jgi:hypothetical protein
MTGRVVSCQLSVSPFSISLHHTFEFRAILFVYFVYFVVDMYFVVDASGIQNRPLKTETPVQAAEGQAGPDNNAADDVVLQRPLRN